MTDNAARFLGFAFASSDLLFEIAPDGAVVFVMGAAQRVLGIEQAQAVGRPWRDIIADVDHDLFTAVIESLSGADRRGPIKIELKAKSKRPIRRFAAFSACRLPQLAPNTSCVLALGGLIGDAAIRPDNADGMHDLEGFVSATKHLLKGAQEAGLDLSLDLVDFAGLKVGADRTGDSEAVFRRISAALRAESIRGEGAARIGDEQFALIRDRADKPDYLEQRLSRAADAAGVQVSATSASLLLAPESTPLHTMRALRYALDSFIREGPSGVKATFQSVLENTVNQANAFSAVVKDRRFELVYQPVVELATGELEHYEALVRFQPDKSPADAIHMAEELELIEGLDLAVVERVAKKINADKTGRLRLAANISARSLMRPAFVGKLLDMAMEDRGLCDRLLFEITETAHFDNVDLANAAIQRLRRQGFSVCLDDFGAGAASMAYLRSLSVDFVKIDGQYVKDVAESGRDSALVRHLTKLCDELGVKTIAEMVETDQAAVALNSMGVGFAQGYRFGRPAAEPVYSPPSAPQARRAGAVESWR